MDITNNITSTSNQITYWENIAKSKWGSYITEIEKQMILKANNLVKNPGIVLEVGCEGGRWSKMLSDLGWNVICTDINSKTLAICKKRIPEARCILVRKEDVSLPCESNSIDLILCIEVPDVICKDWFIEEANRILKKSGVVVGVFQNKFSIRGYFRHIFSLIRGEFDYYKVSYPKWRSKFYKRGFKMLFQEGICWFPFKRGSNSLFVPIFTFLEYHLRLRKIASISPWIVFLAQKREND